MEAYVALWEAAVRRDAQEGRALGELEALAASFPGGRAGAEAARQRRRVDPAAREGFITRVPTTVLSGHSAVSESAEADAAVGYMHEAYRGEDDGAAGAGSAPPPRRKSSLRRYLRQAWSGLLLVSPQAYSSSRAFFRSWLGASSTLRMIWSADALPPARSLDWLFACAAVVDTHLRPKVRLIRLCRCLWAQRGGRPSPVRARSFNSKAFHAVRNRLGVSGLICHGFDSASHGPGSRLPEGGNRSDRGVELGSRGDCDRALGKREDCHVDIGNRRECDMELRVIYSCV